MSNGRRISKTEAQTIMNCAIDIKKNHNGFVEGVSLGRQKPLKMINFYCSPHNAYIFDMDLLLPFINGGAKHLIVFIGAEPEENPATGKEGIQTVVLTGCIEDEVQSDGTRTYRSIPIQDPAIQHPPKVLIPVFPKDLNKSENDYSIIFTETK